MASKTLFKDIADFRTVFPQFHSSGSTTDLFPYLEEAAEKFIYDYISEDFYDELDAALQLVDYVLTDLTVEEQAVIKHLRRAEGYYGIYTAAPHMLLDMSSSGMKETNPDHTSQPRQWVHKENKTESIQKADFFLDKALKVMEADPDSYVTWSESNAFSVYHQFLITNADDFTGINGSRRTFVKLKPYIAQAQDRHVESSISRQLIDALITKKKTAAAFSAEETQLKEYLLKAVSYYALFLGAPELRLDISSDGIRLVSTSDGITGLAAPTDNTIIANTPYGDWLQRTEASAKYYMARAKMYLDDHTAAFADYTDEAQDKDEPNIYAENAITGTTGSIMI